MVRKKIELNKLTWYKIKRQQCHVVQGLKSISRGPPSLQVTPPTRELLNFERILQYSTFLSDDGQTQPIFISPLRSDVPYFLARVTGVFERDVCLFSQASQTNKSLVCLENT